MLRSSDDLFQSGVIPGMNFAEQIAYWYLRLNGFFPLANFVIHHSDENRASDADLVAVRFPHVTEAIGGATTDWDNRFGEQWPVSLGNGSIGLIVEVKSGYWDRRRLIDPDRAWYIRSGVQRMGMIPPGRALDRVVANLNQNAVTRHGRFTLAKLFVGNGTMEASVPWLHISLDDAENFVRNRMRTYSDRKMKDRMFFDGDLIQYFAWKGADHRG